MLALKGRLQARCVCQKSIIRVARSSAAPFQRIPAFVGVGVFMGRSETAQSFWLLEKRLT